MAELDDFFAKKDKKKSKTKGKFVTADELVKNLEEVTKREVAANAVNQKRKPEVATAAVSAAVAAASASPSTGGVAEGGENESSIKVAEPQPPPVEEEWKEFEQEQRKDYSGLKIGQLTINEKQQQQQNQQAADDQDDDDDEYSDDYGNGDSNTNSSGHGPWKKLIPAEEVTQIPVETEKPSAKTYVPPAYRASGLAMGSGSSSGMRARRTAPDITNTEFFPTLNAARPEEQRKKKNEPAFEEVRHGGRYQRVQETTAAPVAATNRFQSLDDEADS
ncbi:hypothetical protein KR044_003609 [Drosophila immigrans]|nr:hypothetical protein KR044_003609 [Drosophila immigrans]